MSENYLISDAARRVKVEAHVLRYWEEELGLPIKRNELGHRYYTEDDVKRFQEIRELKEQGLQLKAIRMVLKNGKLDMLTPKGEENRQGQTLLHEKDQAGQDNKAKIEEREKTERAHAEQEDVSVEQKEVPGEQSEARKTQREVPAIQEETAIRPLAESREEKAARLQWLLQQLIRETLQENNETLCQEIKDSLLKELDYQFRQQEERAEERDAEKTKREEEHYKKIDELLRKKRRLLKK